MPHEWYFIKDGAQRGPLNSDQMRQMFASGELSASDMVWTAGMTDYVQASQVRNVFEGVSSPGGFSYQQSQPAVPYSPADSKKKHLQVVLILLIAAIVVLGSFLGVYSLVSGKRDESSSMALQNSSLPYLGYWKNEQKEIMTYIMFAPQEKAAVVLPLLGKFIETRYQESKQNGTYLISFYNESALEWSDSYLIEVSDTDRLTITDVRNGIKLSYVRVSEQEFSKALSTLAEKDPYLAYRSQIHVDLLTAFIALENLVKNPLYTKQWENELKVAMAVIIVICDDIMQRSAPQQYQVSHDYLQNAASDYYSAIDAIMVKEYAYAAYKLETGAAYYAEAKKLLYQ